MKKAILTIAIIGICSISCKKEAENKVTDNSTISDSATVSNENTVAAPKDSVAMQKAWEKYMTPGDAHKTLAAENGNWDAEATMYMSANDPKPQKTKMTATSKMILGGRYQEERFTGSMMGQPFEGISTVAYNNATKQIESTWVDNMGTGMMFMKGNYDGTSKTMEIKGEFTDPMTGKTKPLRQTYTMADADSRKMEMFEVDENGKEYKSMEIVMTRKK